ncbi:MAG TPA: hypothetical protein VNS88_14070 [Nitrospiraceae bacterium]|nr:hypothetical protein [Nitrospiraceae bacterium]
MTGQIPKYGENFKHDRLPYHPKLASTIYILKRDEEWFIRSDKTSKHWQVFHGSFRDLATPMGKTQPSMTKAMQLLLDGIADGYYDIREEAQPSDGNWHCIHERKAAAAGTWRTDQDWASHCNEKVK